MSLILLADDDESGREAVRNTLCQQGHRVELAGNGEVALLAFDAQQPDLVILDCPMSVIAAKSGMPAMPGIDVLRQIRRSSAGSRTPVLVLTASRGSMDEEIASRAGASDYLRKPFSPIQLLVRVELLLARSPGASLSMALR